MVNMAFDLSEVPMPLWFPCTVTRRHRGLVELGRAIRTPEVCLLQSQLGSIETLLPPRPRYQDNVVPFRPRTSAKA